MLNKTTLFARYVRSLKRLNFVLAEFTLSLKPAYVAVMKPVLLTQIHFTCLTINTLVYNEGRADAVRRYVDWLRGVQLADKADYWQQFCDKMLELNLTAAVPDERPKRGTDPGADMQQLTVDHFHTLWDVVHLYALLIDHMVVTRTDQSHESLMSALENVLGLYNNLLVFITCRVCHDHYFEVRGKLQYEVERIKLALRWERLTKVPIQFVDEESATTEMPGALLKHHMARATVRFHNHVNAYRIIQQRVQNVEYARKLCAPMTWRDYMKKLTMTEDEEE